MCEVSRVCAFGLASLLDTRYKHLILPQLQYTCSLFLSFSSCIYPFVLSAQNLGEPCPSPILSSGYFVPEQQEYTNGTTLTYACDTGHKPVVEGWWATSTCQNGKWSHTPQCIGKRFAAITKQHLFCDVKLAKSFQPSLTVDHLSQ